ncbi:MAG TPA: hypothetical protein ENH82_05890 [bacterium]|nr:hypothetical protein [bacterium]
MIRQTAILGLIIIVVFAVTSCGEDGVSPKEKISPSVSLITPWDGSTREGVVDVAVEAEDNKGINRVELYIGNKLYATDDTEPYTFEWDMSSIADGVKTAVYARAVDVNGNVKSSVTVTVTKGQSAVPVANLTGPSDGTEVMQGYLLEMSGTATDDEDGELGDANITWASDLQGTLGQGATLDYRGFVIGKHVITMIATDSDGNTDKVQVNVTVTDNDQDFAYIQEGTYTIGPPIFEKRTVIFNRPFIISKKELSIGELLANASEDLTELIEKRPKKFEDKNRSVFLYPEDLFSDKYAEYPAIFITLYEFTMYCQTLSEIDGLLPVYKYFDKNNVYEEDMKSSKYAKMTIIPGTNGWRFPTEAEWEVAASGGSSPIAYPWGNEPSGGRCNSMADPEPLNMIDLANGRGVTPVDSYSEYPNRFGLYNMAGNVAEICSDIFLGDLPSGFDPVGYSEARKVDYVVKGGPWFGNGVDMQIPLRAHWIPFDPKSTDNKDAWCSGYGIRLVRNLEVGEAPW